MITFEKNMLNTCGGSTYPCRRPSQTFNYAEKSPSPSRTRGSIPSWNMQMILIIRGGIPKRASTSHSITQPAEWYGFDRSVKQISSKAFLVHLCRYIPCLCFSPPRGLSSPALRRPQLSSPPACRSGILFTHAPRVGKTPQPRS